MKVKLLDLVPQYNEIKDEIERAVSEVLSSQQFILGEKVEELERVIAEYCRVKSAVAVASGSDAILLSLMAMGVGEGDEVITTPYTFFSTVSCITRLGARPVFVDIDPRTFNIDPGGIEDALTGRTRAIIPVHLYGQMAGMGEIMALARSAGVGVIEDACQSMGASRKGRKAGSIGGCGCFSFFPSKNLGGYGDGGMVVTGDPQLAERIGILHLHGIRDRYYHHLIGINSRLDAMQAAVLLVKVKYLDKWNDSRRVKAEYYNNKLKDVEGITVPFCEKDNRCVYHQYVIRSGRRDELKGFLDSKGVGTGLYYPVPLHLQRCFSFLGYQQGDFPRAERAARETLAIPVYPELSRKEQDYVIGAIREFSGPG